MQYKGKKITALDQKLRLFFITKTLGKPSTVLLSVFILYDTGFKKSMGLTFHFFMGYFSNQMQKVFAFTLKIERGVDSMVTRKQCFGF